MRYFYPSFLALISIMVLGGAPDRVGAQSTRNGARNRDPQQVFNRLYRALEDRPEVIESLEWAQAAWFDYYDFDGGAIAQWPDPADPENVEEIKAWRKKMMEQRLARLHEYFTSLSEDEQLKAERPWMPSELGGGPLPYQQLMKDWNDRIRQAPNDREEAAPNLGKERRIKGDKALNEAYSRVMNELNKMHPDVKRTLIKSETAWILYRDWTAEFAAALAGGTKAAAEKKRQQTLENLTAERTALLRRMYQLFPEAFRKKVRPPWPARIRTLDFDKTFRPIPNDKLPAGVLTRAQAEMDASRDVYVAMIDLNQDGVDELIGCYGGGNGGMTYLVYQKNGKRYERIGEIFGTTLQLLTRKNGYNQIGASSKSGGGYYNVTLYEYAKGKYRLARTDRFHQYQGYIGTN